MRGLNVNERQHAMITDVGRALLTLGLVLAGIGLLIMLAGRIPFLGRLPGDLSLQRGNVQFYIPFATSILLSILLTLVINLIARR